VLNPEDLEPLPELLRRNGLAGKREHEFPNDGWSGATMSVLHRGRDRFVLKRDSLAQDWIARATSDGPLLREAWFAAAGPALPVPIRAAYLGAGIADDGSVGMLMPDLTGVLFDWEKPITVGQLDAVLRGLAELHSFPWQFVEELRDRPWCPVPERLTLICRESLERDGPARSAVADRLLPGWDAFDRLAPSDARDLVNDLGRDPQPLIRALSARPPTLIHGDLKLANAGIASDGSIDLVDWQMVMFAPVAIELGWFLVSNVTSLPLGPAALLDRYSGFLEEANASAERDGRSVGGPLFHDEDADLAVLVGLLLRGWRKGYDAEADLTLGSGVPARDDLAWWCKRAVAASARLR
jgi:hypothetical protein